MASIDSHFDTFSRVESPEKLNDMFVKRERVKWLSLTDSITNEVDGLDLSVDFLSSHDLSSTDNASVSIENSPIGYSNMQLHIIQETCESSSLDEGDGDIETEALTETPEEIPYMKKELFPFAPRHYRKPSASTLSMKRLIKSNPTPSTSESNNSDSSIQSSTSMPSKRKAGWPKGRKRKPDISDVRPPKAPCTGYVLYLIERRKNYKHLPFHEVTKLLGNEWTKLDKSQKKVYLDRAEVDKKRYREELRAYRKSDAYQTYLKWKRTKRRQANGTEESDIDATDELDEEDNEELYCKACDQWFVTFHNKKEHLGGKQHLSKCKQYSDISLASNDGSSSYSLDESSLDAAPVSSLSSRCSSSCTLETSGPPSPNMDDNITAVMKQFADREKEVQYLKDRIKAAEQNRNQLKGKISNLECRKNQLGKTLLKLKEEEKSHRPYLLKFWNVLSFFISSNSPSMP